MLYKSLKNVIVLVFLFAILEKTGIELVSFIKWQLEYIEPIEALDISESPREAEKKESKSLHETWIANSYLGVILIEPGIYSNHKHFLNILIFENFHPAVPTPPPNLMIA